MPLGAAAGVAVYVQAMNNARAARERLIGVDERAEALMSWQNAVATMASEALSRTQRSWN